MFCVALLNTFSEKELEDFEHLITCRYFNTDKEVVRLFEILQRYVLGRKNYDEEVQAMIYGKLFKDLPQSRNVLNEKQRGALQNKINTLKGLAEQFLMLESQRKDNVRKYDLLYPKLLERQQFSLLSRHINKDKKLLKKTTAKEAIHYEQSYKVESVFIDYLHQNGRLMKEDNLPELNYNLDLYYLLNKLEIHLTTLSLQWVSGRKKYDVDAIKTTNILLEYPAYAEHPLVSLYLANIRLFESPDDDKYQRLLVLLEEHNDVIPLRLLKHFYTTAINFCMHQINAGKLDYLRTIFELYQILHQKNLMVVDGFIPLSRLKNVIITACRVEEFDWAEQLLEQYKKQVRKPIREHVYRFNSGLIAFYKKDYETAHEKFSRTGNVNLDYDINVRVLILKCLYEKGEDYSEPIVQAFRTAESFFKNHKSLPARRKKGYKNFIRILINLYRIRHYASQMSLERITEKLESQEVNIDRRWLLEKIGEMN